MNLQLKASGWAKARHEETNHLYDGKNYEHHLWLVAEVAHMFMYLVPPDKKDVIIAACWLHDTIEDCRVTYNDVRKEFGEEIAEIVYALTNEKGRNRKERANDKYYDGIKSSPIALFVKICDRIANVRYSLDKGSSMFGKYKQEYTEFWTSLGQYGLYKPMWLYLESLLSVEVKPEAHV